MDDYIRLKKSNCKNCYKCIRNCPVKSIRFSDHQANIVPDECILCGRCFVACPQNAKEVRDDLPAARALLAGGAPVYASVAPSFVAAWEGVTISSMEAALKQLGFAGAEETALGATMVKAEYERLTAAGEQEVIVSTCCHTVNLLVQKHFPEVLPALAKVVSPMQAHCRDLKRRYPGCRTVFIGPCISKKDEAEAYPGIVDCVLTFEELSAWLEQAGVTLEAGTDGNKESRARLFPTTGGILRTMAERNPDYAYLAVDGIDNCITALEDIAAGRMGKCFIEMSACPGSCIGGPAMGKNRRAAVRDFVTVNRYAGPSDFPFEPLPPEKMNKRFPLLLTGQVKPGSAAIEEVLRQMGKARPSDELNCGTCGYDTCREKAAAVLAGKADITMCLPYLKERAESFSDHIIQNSPNAIVVFDDTLVIQQVNDAACRLLGAGPEELKGTQPGSLLAPEVYAETLQLGRPYHQKCLYLKDYDKYVEQMVTYDEGYHILICIMRDITAEERDRERREAVNAITLEVADKVIAKQMRTVQEIASLLGETAAETKVALTKLKESLGHE